MPNFNRLRRDLERKMVCECNNIPEDIEQEIKKIQRNAVWDGSFGGVLVGIAIGLLLAGVTR
ncbi:MAG: hypothetical protein PQJ59_16810 [Spirochaetales bacterium]|nr:hypothetical protein [Spirochaetales bacterium]